MIAIEILLAGAIATAFADLWQQTVKYVSGLPPTNWSIVGRWVAGFRAGAFLRPTIAADAAVPGESAIGWAFHYGVGVIYAAIFIYAGLALGRPTGLAGALAFALVTLAAPWLVLKPALGLGMFGHRAARPWRDLALTATTHLAFGFGLFAGAHVVPAVL